MSTTLEPYPVILVAPSAIGVTDTGLWTEIVVVEDEGEVVTVVEVAVGGGTDVGVLPDSDPSLGDEDDAASPSIGSEESPPTA
tara:strand:+ start:216 stop:464 length:249 start_codon:yes stop_codon:yes gene_type:complete